MGSISREPFIMALFWSTLLFYLVWLRGTVRSIWPAAIFGIFTAWTTDLVLFLLAAVLIFAIFFAAKRNRKGTLVLLGMILAAYTAWIAVRGFTYANHDYYPAGIDGTIEHTATFPWLALINPNFFPETSSNVAASVPSAGLRFSGLPSLYLNPFWNGEAILFALIVLLLLTANALAWRRNGWRNSALCFSIVSLLLLSPLLMGLWPRYALPGILSLGVVFGIAVDELRRLLPGFGAWRLFPPLLASCALLLSIIWIIGHPYLTLNTEMKMEGETVAAKLQTLRGEPVMAPVGLPSELSFLAKKQTLALPMTSENLQLFARKFEVRYVVIPQFSAAGMPQELRRARAVETIQKIEQSPEEFERIAEVPEEMTIAFNWQQRAAWNPTRAPASETTMYRMIHNYTIYRVNQH